LGNWLGSQRKAVQQINRLRFGPTSSLILVSISLLMNWVVT